MLRISIALSTAVAFAVPVAAQTTSTDASSMTCADYIQLQESEQESWVERILSGSDNDTSATADTPAAQTAEVNATQIVAVCENDPDMMVAEAARRARQE